MSKISENIQAFTVDLLHVNDVDKNKLIDLNAGDKAKTYYISHDGCDNISKYVLDIILARYGKTGNTVLRGSSASSNQEQVLGRDVNDLDWRDGNGERDVAALRKYIENVYKELALKGNNPLFLSVGAVRWKVACKDDTVKEVQSPLILFPIKLIRSGGKSSPVYVEFVGDDVYINPCFLAKLRIDAGDKIADEFPHPDGFGVSTDLPVNLERLGGGESYFERVSAYVNAQKRDDISAATTFALEKNVVAIAQYNHDELCMYYDIKRNEEKIYAHPLVNRIFAKGEPLQEIDYENVNAQFILPRDSVQERIIKKVVGGQSLVVKGPPGTGKTLTIINLISSLLAQNKRVLLSSQKTAAMFEVFAKLPAQLRKFVMLLDSETEAQAAKLNVTDVKKEFNELLQEKKTFSPSAKVYGEFDVGSAELSSAVRSLSAYAQAMYGKKDIIGLNYYDALEILCKNDIEPVLFAAPQDAIKLTVEEYNELIEKVGDAEKWFDRISADHGFIKSPWYPVDGDFGDTDIEKAVEENRLAAKKAEQVLAEIGYLLSSVCEGYEELPLSAIEFISSVPVSEKQIASVMNVENAVAAENVKIAYEAYLAERKPETKINLSAEAVSECAETLGSIKSDLTLTKSEFIAFYENAAVLSLVKESGRMQSLERTLELIKEIKVKRDDCESAFYSIFRSDINEENKTAIEQAYEKLSEYDGSGLTAPKLLDFKAKKLYAGLKGLGYGEEIAFVDVVKGVVLYHESASLDSAVKDAKIKMSSQFKIKLEENQFLALFAFAEKAKKSGVGADAYLKAFETDKELLAKVVAGAECAQDYILSELIKAYRIAAAEARVAQAVERYCRAVGEEFINSESLKIARTVYGLLSVVKLKTFGGDVQKISQCAAVAYKNGFTVGESINALVTGLKNFGLSFFPTFYTERPQALTCKDLRVFVTEAVDRNIFNAVNEYLEITLNSSEKFSLERFFRPFELCVRSKDRYSFKEIFERSVFALAVKYYQALMGAARNGLGERTTKSYEEWVAGSATVDKATLSIIESQCMSRVNPDDPDFAFLKSERGVSGETLRKFFKNHARAILKLKKCFILSPSTASVFFGKEDYEQFDIVIIDEASQLEPTAVLPVLFRSKQVVLVGDEWQMPPIKHFTSRTEKRIQDDDGEFKILGQNTSVLGLALENCAFPTERFICHYRSKTESLIAFSQARFYPNMRTFPAIVPKAKGLGFKDVYTPDGRCDGGVNAQEAIATVREFKELFNQYYDQANGVLTQSIGVVAFGKEQKTAIESLVAKDRELSEKISKAIENFDDVPEKLIFFKTIETVQGQEADHLILSITYGKSKTGAVVQSFGELNRGFNEDKLGQCIFNVAVTRAKSSVTVVHSVLGEEITGESVKFIGEYLKTVKRFSQDGKTQWVGKRPDQIQGFVRQVADYVISLGIDESRVVIDCGVNEGSVKLPIVILSDDLSKAQLAIWCEKPVEKGRDFVDENIRYVESLKQRGWKIIRAYIHDWVDNNASEKKLIAQAIEKYVNNQ